MIEKIRERALYRAIKTAGSVRALAEALDVKPARVTMWRHRNKIPAKFVIAVEKATGVSRHLLRPDIYPRADNESRQN